MEQRQLVEQRLPTIRELLASDGVHESLKQCLRILDRQDVVDAASDAWILEKVLKAKCDKALGR